MHRPTCCMLCQHVSLTLTAGGYAGAPRGSCRGWHVQCRLWLLQPAIWHRDARRPGPAQSQGCRSVLQLLQLAHGWSQACIASHDCRLTARSTLCNSTDCRLKPLTCAGTPANAPLYQVLEQRAAGVGTGTLMGSDHTYVLPPGDTNRPRRYARLYLHCMLTS